MSPEPTASGSPGLLGRTRRSAYVGGRALVEARVPYLPAAALERLQARRVRAIVAHAHRWVPHYRETLDELGIAPEDVRTAADLAALPLVERDAYRGAPERFLARDRPPEAHRQMSSSGSSGAPVRVHQDWATRVVGLARAQRRWSIVQRAVGRRGVRHSAIVTPGSTIAELLAANRAGRLALRGRGGAVQQLSMADPPAINLPELNRFRPDAIGSYGSYVEALVLHVRATGAPFHRPRAFVYGSDGISEGMRRHIREELGILLLGAYQAVEAPGMAFECEQGTGMHVNTDAVALRIVDAEGRDVAPGEYGQVVVSNLVNRATVLLNYRVGDVAALLPEPCPCGRRLPLMSYVEGRADDWVLRADGTRVHPQVVCTAFRGEPAIWQWQVVQRGPADLRVALVVPDAAQRHSLADRLGERLRERLGSGVEVAFVDEIAPLPTGKRRAVVSVDRAPEAAPAP